VYESGQTSSKLRIFLGLKPRSTGGGKKRGKKKKLIKKEGRGKDETGAVPVPSLVVFCCHRPRRRRKRGRRKKGKKKGEKRGV